MIIIMKPRLDFRNRTRSLGDSRLVFRLVMTCFLATCLVSEASNPCSPNGDGGVASGDVHVDGCEKEKDCSVQTENATLHCTVGHYIACQKAKRLTEHQGRSSNDTGQYPFLAAVEIYDRFYSCRTVESLMFHFRLPKAAIGTKTGVSGVLTEFYEHEQENENPWYNHTIPVCRYFNFTKSSISKVTAESSKIQVGYKCIGIDIYPSTFVLRLQSVPTSLPLDYVISWTGEFEGDVWTRQLLAVATFPSPGDGVHTSFHVVFQRANPRAHVSAYHVLLLEESGEGTIQEEFLVPETNDGAMDIFFHGVKAGKYKVKVIPLGGYCEQLQCPPLLSPVITVENRGPATTITPAYQVTSQTASSGTASDSDLARVESAQRSEGGLLESNLLVMLGVSGFVAVTALSAVCIYLIWRRRWGRERQRLLFGGTKNSKSSVFINVASLADRSLEKLVSEHFAQFLIDAVGATVNLTLPCMTPDFQRTISTGSDEPLLGNVTQTPMTPEEEHLANLEVLSIVIDFFYGTHNSGRVPTRHMPGLSENNQHPTKDVARLNTAVRQALATTGRENVWCVTFAHQCAPPSIAQSVITSRYEHEDAQSNCYTEGGKSWTTESDVPVSIYPKSRPQEDTQSLTNWLDSGGTTTCGGVAQYFLPADRHKLYSELRYRINKQTDGGLLDSEHSESLWAAFEVFKKAADYPTYNELDENSCSSSSSLVTLPHT